MQVIRRNGIWVIIFAALCAAGALSGLLLREKTSHGDKIAQIKQGNIVVRTLNLSTLLEPYEFEVTDGNGGYNKIRAEHNRIAVVEANCPDKICVKQGTMQAGYAPIVCLPHKLSIVMVSCEGEPDAVTGGK